MELVPQQFLACAITIAIIEFVLLVLAVWFCIQYWTKDDVRFPQVNMKQSSLLFCALASLAAFLFCAINPWQQYFRVTTQGFQAYSILVPLEVSFCVCAYAVLTAYWLQLLATVFGRLHWQPRIFRVVCCWVLVTFLISLILGTKILNPSIGSAPYVVFMAWIVLTAVLIEIIVIVSASYVIRRLRLFKVR